MDRTRNVRRLSSARLREHADNLRTTSLSFSASDCLCLPRSWNEADFSSHVQYTQHRKRSSLTSLDRELPNARGRKLKRRFVRLLHRTRHVSRRDAPVASSFFFFKRLTTGQRNGDFSIDYYADALGRYNE